MTNVRTDDAVYGMWQGERICEILGYVGEHEWDRTSILNYLTTLIDVHDKWIETAGFYTTDFHSVEPLTFGSSQNNLVVWKTIRDSVMNTCFQYPNIEVVDVIEKLGLTVEQFIVAVTVNKCKTIMNSTEFRSFSYACLSDNPNFAKIGRDYNTGVNTMKYYKKLFRGIKEQQGQMIEST